MKTIDIFLSWSGEQSKIVAKALKDWLPLILGKGVKPWFSASDIGAGDRFILEIGRSLEASGIGILCVTSQNIAAPWMLFEAGALSKSFDRGAVIPYLIDLEVTDLVDPLKQFQSKKATREGTLEILSKINRVMGQRIGQSILESKFNSDWPKLEKHIQRALSAPSTDYLSGWWVYSLLAETPYGLKDTVGHFRMRHTKDDMQIDEGRAFWVEDTLRHRGNWRSNTVWIRDNVIKLIYSMTSGKIMEGLPTDYEGYIELSRSSQRPILGDSSWTGSFNDLKHRGVIKGPVYAERLLPLVGHDPTYLKAQLRKKRVALLARVREFL